MFESSLEMWNFQTGSKLWDAQPISSMQSLKSLYKILEIDLARSVFSCLSCRALRWQQSCHRGMEVRSMLFGKQVHTMSGLEFLREKVRTDMIY